MTTKTNAIPVPLKFPAGSHRKFGRYDRKGRWFPSDEIKQVENAFEVSSPTKSFPYSFLHHFYTRKLAGLVALEAPDLYCKIHEIDKRHNHYKQVMAWRVKTKIKLAAKEAQDA